MSHDHEHDHEHEHAHAHEHGDDCGCDAHDDHDDDHVYELDLLVQDWSKFLPIKYLVDRAGKKVPVRSLQGKAVALYWGAHWCPPCADFNPLLATAYTTLREQKEEFEVVYMSWDHTPEHFKSAMSTMPWLAVPFGEDLIQSISEELSIPGLPVCLLFDTTGKCISTNGIGVIEEEGAQGFPWHPEVGLLRELSMNLKNQWSTHTSVILMMEGAEAEEAERLQREFRAFAEEEHETNEVLFFQCTKPTVSAFNVRGIFGLSNDKDKVSLLILDLEGEGAKFRFEGDAASLNKATMSEFLLGYSAGTLTPCLVSAPRPEQDLDPEHANMHIVVGSSFDEILQAPGKPSIVSVWAEVKQEAKVHVENVALVFEDMAHALVFGHINAEDNELNPNLFDEPDLPIVKYFANDGTGRTFTLPTGEFYTADIVLEWLHSACSVAFDLEAAKRKAAALRTEQFEALVPELEITWNILSKTARAEEKAELKMARFGYESCMTALLEANVPMDRLQKASDFLIGEFEEGNMDKDSYIEFWRRATSNEGVGVDAQTLMLAVKQELVLPCSTSQQVCSLVVTGKNMYKQEFFQCLTCSPEPGTGCCAACVLVCHDGHQVVTASAPIDEEEEEHHHEDDVPDTRTADCYCDCGAGSMASPCSIMKTEWYQ